MIKKVSGHFKMLMAVIFNQKRESFLLCALVIILFIIYFPDFKGDNLHEKYWHWIDPVAGIMTFVTSLVIFYLQAKTRWEESLDKQLNVDYIYINDNGDSILLAQVVGAYLSGSSDVRQWAQSLGGQMMGNLDFDMNWDDERKPAILKDQKGEYYKSYVIKIYLTTNPFELKPRTIKDEETQGNKDLDTKLLTGRDILDRFKSRRFKHSEVSGSLDELPIVWKRKEI